MDIRFFEKGNTLHKDEVEMKKAMFSLFMGDDSSFLVQRYKYCAG